MLVISIPPLLLIQLMNYALYAILLLILHIYMLSDTDRIVGEKQVVDQVYKLLACSNCHKSSLYNLYYEQACHSGVYCHECIQFCLRCKATKGLDVSTKEPLLLKVSIKCKYCFNGCAYSGPFNSLLNHENSCKNNHENSFPSYHTDSGPIPKYNEFFPNLNFVHQEAMPTPDFSDMANSNALT